VLDCGEIDPLIDGNIDIKRTTFGSRAVHICLDGYTLSTMSDSYVRVCTLTGNWSGTKPRCSEFAVIFLQYNVFLVKSQ